MQISAGLGHTLWATALANGLRVGQEGLAVRRSGDCSRDDAKTAASAAVTSLATVEAVLLVKKAVVRWHAVP